MEELKQTFADSPNYQRLPNMGVRMITIEGCRPIACGGTHLRNVSEAREIRVEKAENMGEGFRIYYDAVQTGVNPNRGLS